MHRRGITTNLKKIELGTWLKEINYYVINILLANESKYLGLK